MDIRYAVKRNGKWLHGIDINEKYHRSSKAPTMGNCYVYSEYKTLWGNEPEYFEPLTLAGYIKILTEEYRWGDKKPVDFKVICMGAELLGGTSCTTL